MNFLAIDFETANEKYYSACSLGMVIVDNGKVSVEKQWLIKPPDMYFDPFNVKIHGITKNDVIDKPEFNRLWDEIKDYFNNRIVFAHNASFDIFVLKDLLDYYNIPHPNIKYVCTVNLSRKLWDLQNYKLNTVANHIGCEFKHHDSIEDSRVCAEIVLKGCSETKSTSIDELLKYLKIRKKAFPKNVDDVETIKSHTLKPKYNKALDSDTVAKSMQNIGCILTIFITIPVIILIIFLIMCSK